MRRRARPRWAPSRRASWLLSPWLWLAAAMLLCPHLLLAQEDDEFVPEEEEEATEAATDFQAIDDLLALDEEVLSDPGTYSYDPGARRDPFRSLLTTRETDDGDGSGPCDYPKDDPRGLLIDEIEIQGIFVLPEGPVAQILSSSRETSFLLRPGDQLCDGDVVRITLDEVAFKQSVDDPTALKPFREVVKRLTR